ncbi:MAG: DUF1178 family protein [Alphaproteobacteria bacterium]
MIVYRLKCAEGHEFDSWFKGSEAFDTLAAAGELSCCVCGSHRVTKAPMAPNIATKSGPKPSSAPARETGPDLSPAEILDRMHALARQLRKKVIDDFDNVGDRFAEEARLIHYGESDSRGIYGEATPGDVQDLIEEGIAVAPLPSDPDKAN